MFPIYQSLYKPSPHTGYYHVANIFGNVYKLLIIFLFLLFDIHLAVIMKMVAVYIL